jgi:hypothetical protein
MQMEHVLACAWRIKTKIRMLATKKLDVKRRCLLNYPILADNHRQETCNRDSSLQKSAVNKKQIFSFLV